MPPRDEPPLENEDTDNEALGSDTDSIPELEPAQGDDDLALANENPPEEIMGEDQADQPNDNTSEDSSNDAEAPENDANPQHIPWMGNPANPMLFTAFLANIAQQLQESEGDPPPNDTSGDTPTPEPQQ